MAERSTAVLTTRRSRTWRPARQIDALPHNFRVAHSDWVSHCNSRPFTLTWRV